MNEKTQNIIQKVIAGSMLAAGVVLIVFSLGMVFIPILGVVGIFMLVTAISAVIAASRLFNTKEIKSFSTALTFASIFVGTVLLFPIIQVVSGEGLLQWILLIVNAAVAFISPLVVMRQVSRPGRK